MITVASLIREHALATNIIERHNTDDSVLDRSELELLQTFCAAPPWRDTILSEHDMADEAGAEPGTKAQQKGSLAGYCIARHGTEKPVFEEREIEMLRKWFESGGAEWSDEKRPWTGRRFFT